LLAVCGTVSLIDYCVVLSHAHAGAFVLCARLLCLSVAQNCAPTRPHLKMKSFLKACSLDLACCGDVTFVDVRAAIGEHTHVATHNR
jgi:hypothetical protein